MAKDLRLSATTKSIKKRIPRDIYIDQFETETNALIEELYDDFIIRNLDNPAVDENKCDSCVGLDEGRRKTTRYNLIHCSYEAMMEVPLKYKGIVLTPLGCKNYMKLLNSVTGHFSEPPKKSCKRAGCGNMDWRMTGQIFKPRNGRYTYQQYCQRRRKTEDNDVCGFIN